MSSKTYLLKRITQAALIALVGGFLSTAPANAVAYEATISGSCVYRNTPAGAGVGGFVSVSVTKGHTGKIALDEYNYTNDVASYGSAHTAVTDRISTVGALDTSTPTVIIPITDTWTTNAKSVTYRVWVSPAGTVGSAPGDEAAVAYVTCNAAGAPASYSLSATSASKSAGETATFTVTPKDAAGNTTILTPGSETITAQVSTTVGTANLQAGKPNGASGAGALNSALGASIGWWDSSTTLHKARSFGAGMPATSGRVTQAATMPSTTGTTAAGTINLISYHADALPTLNAASDSATATGAYTLQVRNSAAATATVSVTGTGASSAATFTLTSVDSVYGKYYGFGSTAAVTTAGFGIITGGAFTTTGAALVAPSKAYPAGNGSTGSASSASTTFQVSTAKTSIPMTWQLSTNGAFSYTVAAVTNVPVPTGITAGTYTITPSGGETITTVTFTTTAPVAGQGFKVTWSFDDNITRTATFSYEAPKVGTGRGSVTLTNTESSKKIAAGGTGSAEVTVKDQFGSLLSGATVLWTNTGSRNTSTATTATTNSSGKSTFTWTDADSTKSLTTYATDGIKAEVTYGNTGTYLSATTTYTYVSALTAGSVTVTNDASDDVAADSAVTYTVTVRDSASAALSGYPVTVSGFTNSYNTGTGVVYTGTNGTVTFTAYCKTAGDETLTFTSGGKSATSTATCVAGSARTYSIDKATVSMAPGDEAVVTATVVDRYGNPVEDQTVTVTYVGTGGVTKINGVQASSGTTDANGKVAITLGASAAGTGTLTVKSTMGYASTAATRGDGTAMPAKSAATGFTSAVTISGQAAIVTAAEAAADAAAEAIDAANAATDAANLAAEAADAATVAAEEARDAADAATAAVEELATQVATLMAALKAQITTLANTVAKIAKKVKA